VDLPRIGVSLPTFGPYAGPDAVATVATAAERLGFYGVSATERLLLPATPGWQNTYGLPETPVYDPLEMLTWAAAHTKRVRLSTAVLVSLFQPPIVLARRLATLDQLSGGRLDVGLGQGWLPEEFTAAGVPMTRRGAGFEEHLAAMRACWAPDPVEHDGPRYRISRSHVGPKPVNGRLPVLIGAGSQPAIERAARLGAGFISALWDWDVSRQEIDWYRHAGGTGPVLLRIFPKLADTTGPFTSFVQSVIDDLTRSRSIGADEVHIELTLANLEPHSLVEALETLASTIKP
jgi:probable F420-dependent oxidoreductase